jgi:subtilisin family serine protease
MSSQQTNGAAAPGATNRTVGPRSSQYMVASRQSATLAPLSADVIAQSLSQAPGVEIVKTIKPPAALGLQALAMAGVGGTGGFNTAAASLVVAKMPTDRADLLKTQGSGQLLVEHDAPLTYGLDPGPVATVNPGVLIPLSTGFSTIIEVIGANGPLKEAEIYLFGSMLPAQGVTDEQGRATLRIAGEGPETMRALYVKPKVDYWDLWMPNPALAPDTVNTVTVKPLSTFIEGFPDRQLLGWGQRAMGLDQVPTSYDGKGIKVAIIDSGAAQVTHRNLHKVGPGFDVVGNDKDTWTKDLVGHGSHVAGIIAGSPSSSGIRGFAPAAEIHVLRIFPGARFSDLVGALDYCIENGIDVVNMSLGGGEPSQIVEERLVKAKSMGVACIIATGNSSGPVQFPASTAHALAVAAIGKSGEFPPDSFHATQMLQGFEGRQGYFPAKFSCFGPEVDVCAPGVAIVSSLPPDDFAAWDGTSMATPHVTGMAALVLAHHPDFKGAFQARNANRVDRLFQIIKESATPMPIADRTRVGVGMPNVARALGLLAADASIGAATAPVQADAIDVLRRFIAALATQNAGTVPLGPASFGLQSFNGVAPPTSDVDNARNLLRQAGLL